MEEHWITPMDTLPLTRAKILSDQQTGMGSSALEAERLYRSFGRLRLTDSSHLRALNFREKSPFFNVVRREIQGGGYKTLDAEDFLRGTSTVQTRTCSLLLLRGLMGLTSATGALLVVR